MGGRYSKNNVGELRGMLIDKNEYVLMGMDFSY